MATIFDPEKFRELILYIAGESQDDSGFGVTKLSAILYFSDFNAFGRHGKSITGATYRRLDHGPAPSELLAALWKMDDDGDIERVQRQHANQLDQAVRARRPSKAAALLTPREMAIVTEMLHELKNLTAAEVAELSRREPGWRSAYEHEAIPYETVYISNRRPTRQELDLLKRDADERRSHRPAS